MKSITRNLLESLNESISGNTIKEYTMNYLDGYIDNDVTDTEIDMSVAFSFDFNEEPDADFKAYSDFMNLIAERTKVIEVQKSSYGDTLVCDFSSVFKPYNEQLKEFFDMDNSEFGEDEAYYEAVANLEALISGNAGESTYRELIDILNSKPMNEAASLTAEVTYHNEDGTRDYTAGKLSDGRYFLIGQQEQIIVSDKDLPSLAKKDMDDFSYDEDGDKEFIKALENGTTLDKNSDLAKVIINTSRKYLDDGCYLLSESTNIDVNNLTKEQLWKLRQEIVLGSLYTHDYDNSFGIDPSAVSNFFDSFIEDAQMDDYGRPNNRKTEEYDNAEDLYNYYRSCENPFGEVENINESEDVKRDLAIEPGSDEEAVLDSLYDRKIKNYICSYCRKSIKNINDFDKKFYKGYGTEYACPYCGEPYSFKDLKNIARYEEV